LTVDFYRQFFITAVSTSTPELIRNCPRCSQELAPGGLVCEKCQALVNSAQLEKLSAEAKALEAKGDFQQAREQWLMGLRLLPPNSRQADWILTHARELESKAAHMQPAPPSENKWAKRLGPLGPVAILLAKGKTLLFAIFKLKFLFSIFAFAGVYWAAFGWKFGLGFTALILLHEMGHYIDIRRRGLPAEMPVFLPGLGAYVRWQALGVSLETRAAVSLSGPLAGLITAIVCAALWQQTGNPLWAGLARAGAILNLLNLAPVWVLDGGQAVVALDKMQRVVLLVACLACWWFFSENMFLLVAAGATYAAFFAKDIPPRPSPMISAYFIAVMAGLGEIAHLMPGHGLGLN
jgi:Zn-dependent protease